MSQYIADSFGWPSGIGVRYPASAASEGRLSQVISNPAFHVSHPDLGDDVVGYWLTSDQGMRKANIREDIPSIEVDGFIELRSSELHINPVLIAVINNPPEEFADLFEGVSTFDIQPQ